MLIGTSWVYNNYYGKNKADRQEVDCPESAQKTAGCSEGGQEVGPHLLRA
jgi:hypothetical protein